MTLSTPRTPTASTSTAGTLTQGTQSPALRRCEHCLPVLETERLVAARAAPRRRQSHRPVRRRPPRRGEHRAHSASLSQRRCRAIRRGGQSPRRRSDVRCSAQRRHDRHVRCRAARGRARDRLLARRAALGPRLCHRSGARGDRLCLRRSRPRGAATPARASAIRPRAGCWKSAASNGPASASIASAPSIPRRRSTASASTAACGPRSRPGGG